MSADVCDATQAPRRECPLHLVQHTQGHGAGACGPMIGDEGRVQARHATNEE